MNVRERLAAIYKELGLEVQEDFPDRYEQHFHDRHHPPPVSGRTAIELYFEQELGLIVQVRLRKRLSIGAVEARDFLAAFAYPWGRPLSHGHESLLALRQGPLVLDHEEIRRRCKQMDMAMLVGVVEFMENSQRVQMGVLPAAKWLMAFDPRDEVRRDAPLQTRGRIVLPANHLLGEGVELGSRNAPNREIERTPGTAPGGKDSGACGRFVSYLGQTPDEVIQGGPQVVTVLTEDYTPVSDRGFCESLGVDRELVRMLGIQLGIDNVMVAGFNPRIDHVVEFYTAFLCPLQFQPMSRERIRSGHAK